MKQSLLFVFIFLTGQLLGQLGFSFYGQSGNDVIYQITPAGPDSYFLLGGKAVPKMQIWLAKIHTDGTIIWEHTYGDDGNVNYSQIGYQLLITEDSTFYIAAQARHNTNSGKKGIILKTDQSGNLIWKKTYSEVERILNLSEDGNEILVAGLDFWSSYVIRIDTSGSILSNLPQEVSGQTFVYRILKTDDGNLLLVGRANAIGAGYSGLFFRKITREGETLWTKAQETNSRDDDFSNITELFEPTLGVLQDHDGSIWIANHGLDPYGIDLFQFDNEGNKLKTFHYGDNLHDEFPTSLIQTSDGSFLITGATKNDSIFSLKVKPNGIEQWYRYYGDKNVKCIGMSAVEIADRYLIGGTYQKDIEAESDYDGTILRIEKDGNPFSYTIHGILKFDQNQNCLSDPSDPVLPNWFVMATDAQSSALMMTDQSGYFEYKTNSNDLQVNLILPDTSIWGPCEDTLAIHVDTTTPNQNVTLLVLPKDACGNLEVSLTQPDFVKCETNCLTVTIINRGNITSEASNLRIDWDKELQLTSSTDPYQFIENGIEIVLPALEIKEEYRIQLCFALDCDVQLGSAHQINASIVPLACSVDYTGPFISLKGWCEGGEVKFSLRNTGSQVATINTNYSVYSNELLISNDIPIQLPGDGAEKIITFPADGRTWRVEVEQIIDVPFPDHPTASIESCGSHNTGLHDVGLRNAFPTNDFLTSTSSICGANTYKSINQIAAAVTGIGSYNFIDHTGAFEFTSRVNNNVKDVTHKVSFELTFSTTFDVSTFQILSSTVPVELMLLDHHRIRIQFSNINLLKGQSAMVRFRISTITGLIPNENSSFLKIQGNAYLDDIGPIMLSDAYYNYGQFEQSEYEQFSTYPDFMQIYGGRNVDFGSGIAKGDGDYLFLAGSTRSFGDGTSHGYIINTNMSGKIEWQKIIEPEALGSTNIYRVVPDGEGGCVFAGSFLPAEDAENYNYTHFYYGVIGRLNGSGQLLWIKTVRPINPQFGTTFRGVVKTADQNYIAYGTVDEGDFNRVYLKFNNNGDSIWVRQFTSYRVGPYNAVSYSNGNVIFVGNNLYSPSSDYTIAQKVNSAGILLWERIIDHGILFEGAISVAPDNGFLLAARYIFEKDGESRVGLRLTLCDSLGLTKWVEKHEFDDYYNMEILAATNSGDSGYFITGYVHNLTTNNDDDVILFKVDSLGKIIWTKQYGGPKREAAFDIICTSPDSAYIFGFDQSEVILFDLQSFLIRADGQGEVTALHDEPIPNEKNSTWLFPNPAKENINVLLIPQPTQTIRWKIFDLLGRQRLEGMEDPSDFIGINTSLLAQGHYVLCFPGTSYPSRIFVLEN